MHDKLYILAYMLGQFSVNTLELRKMAFYHDNINGSALDFLEGAIAEIEELDVPEYMPLFIVKYNWCNVQPRLTLARLSLCIPGPCGPDTLADMNDLLCSLGRNLGELCLRISWRWGRWNAINPIRKYGEFIYITSPLILSLLNIA